MTHTINVCPECDSSQLRHRHTRAKSWYCGDCKREFDAPAQREQKRDFRSTLTGTAKRLWDADPEDVL